MSKLLSGFLGLALLLVVGLGALWLVGGVPPSAVLRLASLPPGATVSVRLHSPSGFVITDASPVVRIGDTEIQCYGPPVDGITYDQNGLRLPAVQFARLEGQPVAERQGGYEWLYGPLDGSRITQDSDGQYVLRMDEDVPLTLRRWSDDLRAVRAGVTNPQAIALLDLAVRDLTSASGSAAWRDTLRLHPAGGEQVFAALQSGWGNLQALMDDPRLFNSLGEDGRQQGIVATIAHRMLHVAQSLAGAAIEEAQAAGTPPEALRPAVVESGQGRGAEMQDRPEALQHYYTAWQLAVQAMPPATPTP